MSRKIEIVTNQNGSLSVSTTDALKELEKLDVKGLVEAGNNVQKMQETVDGVSNQIGILSELETTEKSNLVKAINEAKNSGLTEQQKQDLATAKTDATAAKTDAASAKMEATTARTEKIPATRLDTSVDANKIKQIHLSDEVKQMMTGTTPVNATPAPGSITKEKFAPGAIDGASLADGFDYQSSLDTGDDLNTVYRSGTYLVLANAKNKPLELAAKSCVVTVRYIYNRYVVQEIFERNNAINRFVRAWDKNTPASIGAWTKVLVSNDIMSLLVDKGITNAKLNDNFQYVGSLAGGDLNTIQRTGWYIISAVATNRPPEVTDSSAYLSVYSVGSTIIQDYIQFNKYQKIYRRYIKSGVVGDWFLITPDPDRGSNYYTGKKIVFMGDSITGNQTLPALVGKRLGATTYNCGFGGTRMSYHTDPNYDAFSMTKLADAIVSGDFSLQDPAAVAIQQTANLAILKTIDFTKIDYLHLWFGTNDFTGGILIGTDTEKNTTTFKGSMNYVLDKLITKFPHLRIMITTPMWRANFSTNDGNDSDSYPHPNSKLYLKDYVTAAKEISAKYHVPCFDMYANGGVNKINYTYFLRDGLHPNPTVGDDHFGNKVASFISGQF